MSEAASKDNPDATPDLLEQWKDEQRRESPLIEDDCISLVLSNCVLNLVDDHQKKQLVDEIYRVTKPGGRIAISDIISDQPIPQSMKDDPELWSGCISGAFGEKEFLDAFAAAGFADVRYDKWDNTPWKVIDDIEFRSVTVVASKPRDDLEQRSGSVIYRGPYQNITTDDGSTYIRGERYELTAQAKSRLLSVHASDFIDIEDREKASAGCCVPGNGCC